MDHQKPSEKSGCSLPFFPISFFCSPGTSFFDRIRLSFDRHAANQRLIKKKEINRDRSNETRQSTNDRHSKKKRKKRNKREKKSSFFLYGSEPFISIGVVRLSFLAFRFYHPVSLRATARIGLVAGGWMGFDRVPLRVAGFLV